MTIFGHWNNTQNQLLLLQNQLSTSKIRCRCHLHHHHPFLQKLATSVLLNLKRHTKNLQLHIQTTSLHFIGFKRFFTQFTVRNIIMTKGHIPSGQCNVGLKFEFGVRFMGPHFYWLSHILLILTKTTAYKGTPFFWVCFFLSLPHPSYFSTKNR